MSMKTIITAIACVAAIFTAGAQEEIQFKAVAPPQSSGLSDAASELLLSKVNQILNRNSAASGGDFGVFIVEPSLTVSDTQSTSGMVQNVSVVKGELVLTAKNDYDNSAYYSVTVPLKATTKKTGVDNHELLARSIKITEPVFVRFIRTARENISKSFDNNCEAAVTRAKALFVSDRPNDATSLLMAIPPQAPCSDDAMELLAGIRKKMADDRAARADSTASPAKPAPEPVADGDSEPVTDSPARPDTKAPETPASDVGNPEIYISDKGWAVKVESCEYIALNKKIEVNMKVTATDNTFRNLYVNVNDAVSSDGDTYKTYCMRGNQFYFTFPENVGIKIQIDLNDVKKKPSGLALLKFKVGPVDFEIKNIKVK